MTKKLRRPPKATPALYAQDGKGMDATVHAHYFGGSNDWWVTEYDPEQDLAFGFACIGGDTQNAELGYVSLAELETLRYPVRVTGGVNGTLRLPIEHDNHWTRVTLREALEARGIR